MMAIPNNTCSTVSQRNKIRKLYPVICNRNVTTSIDYKYVLIGKGKEKKI